MMLSKSVYSSACVLLLISSYVATQSTNSSQCGATSKSSCMQPQQANVCSSLGGRESNYITSPNLPLDVQDVVFNIEFSDLTLQLLLEQTESPPACYEWAIHQLCLIIEPPCDPNTSAPLFLCPETCRAYDKLISSGVCRSYANNIIRVLEKSSVDSYRALANRFRVFNCSDPATYFQNSTADVCETSSCTYLFSTGTQESIINMESLFSCETVSGSPCQAWFPGMFTNAIRVPGRGEEEEENIFNILAKVSPSLDGVCSQWLNFIACNYLHPGCNENGEQVGPCKGECEVTSQVLLVDCRIVEILGTLNITTMSPFIDNQLKVNCSDPETYLIPTVPVDKSSCLSAASLLYSAGDENDSSLNAVYIGAIVGGAVLVGLLVVLLTVAVIVLCTTRYKMKKTQYFLGHFTLSQRLSLQLQGLRRTISNRQRRNGRLEGGDGGGFEGDEQEVLTLPEREQRELELQFAGCIVPFSSLTVDTDNCLGQGAFGKVYSGDTELGGIRNKVAIKTIKRINSEEQLRSFLAESLIMKDFKHPHVLGLLGVCFDTPDHSPYIILPLMANGSVKSFLRAKRVHPTNFDSCPVGLKFGDLVRMCMEIAEGMKYLTDNKFVHRDLAARNCMVNEEGTVLVGDFGLARDIYTAEYYRKNRNAKLPVKWMPPETLNDGISNEKTDAWSYGVTCWEVFSLGRSPYPGIENHEILQHISSGGRLNKPTLCPGQLYPLLLQCWSLLPEDRPSFTELCALLKDYWDEEHLYVVQSFQRGHVAGTHQNTF